MEYYISPSWIYWINVVDSLRAFFISLMIISGGCIVLALPVAVADNVIEESTFKKLEIAACVVFMLSLFCMLFVPSKQVLIEMEVAKFATKQNVELTVESLKSVVDYIVDAITKLK